MNYVYVVTRDYGYEGESVDGVYSTLDLARLHPPANGTHRIYRFQMDTKTYTEMPPGGRRQAFVLEDAMKPRKYGSVVKRTRCLLCGKRRECRIDSMNGYFTAESSGKLIPACLSKCSRYKGP